MLHPGHDPGSVDGQRPLGIHLHIGIGVAHLSNEQVQQYHNDHEEECDVNDYTKPPGSGEKWHGLFEYNVSDKPWPYT